MQIQFTDEQVRELRRLAADRGVSMSAVVREAVEKDLMLDETDAKWRRALAVVGRFGGAESDISEHHDHYLAEDFRSQAALQRLRGRFRQLPQDVSLADELIAERRGATPLPE